AKTGIESDVIADRHPLMDYYALKAELCADLADYRAVEAEPHPFVRAARRISHDLGIAAYGFVHRRKYDVVFSNGENVGIPLAGLLKRTRNRPRHVLIGHRLSTPKKRRLLRATHSCMDTIFVYAATQREYGRALG